MTQGEMWGGGFFMELELKYGCFFGYGASIMSVLLCLPSDFHELTTYYRRAILLGMGLKLYK